jgi:lysophospholipase L1-like esterase
VLAEQVPVALDAEPDLVSLIAGGNDLLRPGGNPDALAAALDEAVGRLRAEGADVLLAATGVDPRRTPIIRRIRGKVAAFKAHVWSIAARRGAAVLDQWGAAWLQDRRMWDSDRIHLAEGHRRVARGSVAPWVGRRLRGRSSGDGRAPKRPVPLALPRP